jgi:hypothetical protein
MLLKNLFKKPWVQFTLLFLVINSLGLLGFFIYLPRSIFYYEYGLVLLALMYSKSHKISFILFVLFLMMDLLDIISNIYLFTLNELIASIEFIKEYKISWQHLYYVISLIIYLYIIYIILKKFALSARSNKNDILKSMILVYVIIFLIDVINGSSKLNAKNDTYTFTQKNIAKSIGLHYWEQIYQSFINPVTVIKLKEEPVVFKNFKEDSVGNQLVVLIESWGLINDSKTQEALQAYLSSQVKIKEYQFSWGKSPFAGPTTSAALRQMVGVKGNYKYFLHHKSDTNNIISIFDYKNKQGYTTYGFHSFSENMFNRKIWWQNIGVRNENFKESYIKDNDNQKIKIIEDSPFPSINDLDMFNYMLLKTKDYKKTFSYLLTENTHLPFRLKVVEKNPVAILQIESLPISNEAQNQLKLIKNTVSSIIQKLDTSRWNKIIIMGDHNPPYLDIRDRNYYSFKEVPYILIYKK